MSYKPEQLLNNQRPISHRAIKKYEKKISTTCKIIIENESTDFFVN